MFHGHFDHFHKPPLGGGLNTKPRDHGTPYAHNRRFILLNHVWGPARIKNHWNSIWLRVWVHMTSHYTWGSVTTLHDFEGVLARPLDTFFWALTISWSRLPPRVWSGPNALIPRIIISCVRSHINLHHRFKSNFARQGGLHSISMSTSWHLTQSHSDTWHFMTHKNRWTPTITSDRGDFGDNRLRS